MPQGDQQDIDMSAQADGMPMQEEGRVGTRRRLVLSAGYHRMPIIFPYN